MLMGSITPVITPSAYAESEQDTVVRTADETGPISKHEIPTEETPAETPAEEPAAEPTETTETAEPTEAGPIAPAEQEAKPLEIEFIEDQGPDCSEQLSPVGWLICPIMEVTSKAVDSLYDVIENLLVVQPLSTSGNSSIYTVWNYCLGITNVVFIIFFLIVIYSQITGFGISNYGIKKVLPKLIVAVILVNLSFHICALAVDVSNIIGASLRGFFENIPIQLGDVVVSSQLSFSDAAYAALGGAGISIGVGLVAFEAGALFMMIPAIIGGLIAIVSGLITIAIRQAVVILLVMISPLALVCYMLPNTENLFKKWKNLFTKMLVFYPLFSLLFGASNLAGWAIIVSALNNGSMFMVILGLAVQVFPLFACWSLMKMSGTFLSSVNNTVRGLAAKPLAANRAWAESMRSAKRAKSIASGTTPYSRLQQYLANRKTLRELDMENNLRTAKSRASIYAQHRIGNYKDVTEGQLVANGYTRRMKRAKNLELEEKNAAAHVEHTMTEYKSYYGNKDKVARIDALIAQNRNYEKGKAKALTAAETREMHRLAKDKDYRLADQSAKAYLGFIRSAFVKEIDDENDINFMVDQFLDANHKDALDRPTAPLLYKRYVESVGGELNTKRVLSKVITQAAKVESKQRSEYNTYLAKYGHNGYNKREFRDWILGYRTNDDGWAIDKTGNRVKWTAADAEKHLCAPEEVGSDVETVPGDVLRRAPHRAVLYDKRDENGLYFDFRDQYGTHLTRIYRNGGSNDDAAFIKEVLSNYDIPIGDPINDIYGILSGISPNDTILQDENGNRIKTYIGLDRYSTTIGRALMASGYKSNAPWAGSMFASMVGNRQITTSAQQAIAVLDSIKKTMKPGTFNTQNPASAEYLKNMLFNPDNWEKIFDEQSLREALNINNEHLAGEIWATDKNGNVIVDEMGKIKRKYNYDEAEWAKLSAAEREEAERELERLKTNPTYEELMNTVKTKYIFPAIQKILPAFDRLRTSGTADNQKPGTADAFIDIINLINDEEKWGEKRDKNKIPFNALFVNQDLSNEARMLREKKVDKNGEHIFQIGHKKENSGSQRYATDDNYTDPSKVADVEYSEAIMRMCNDAVDADMLTASLRSYFIEHGDRFSDALAALDEHCSQAPNESLRSLIDYVEEELKRFLP